MAARIYANETNKYPINPILCEEKALEIDGEQIIYSRTNYYQVEKWKGSYAHYVKLDRTEGSN
jgi:hypothetical protein